MAAIKSLNTFKKVVRKNSKIYLFSGHISKEVYYLYYGFTCEIELGESNLKAAYAKYKANAEHYDKFIAKNSFLLDKK